MPCLDLAAQLARWASRGPRYTSYPPATQLGPIDRAQIARELAALADQPISLYVHVPFCRSLCWYCGCNVVPTRDSDRGVDYVERLIAEAAALGAHVPRAPVHELALGGGSPNFLSAASLATLLAGLERHFAFSPDARRSVELDPRTTTSSQLDVLAAAGFRALSMGVQDFAPAVQDAIHRHQSRRQTRWLVDSARAAGFADVNLDLVYGLPQQTPASFAATLDAVLELAPDRVALFGYAHLPDRLPHQRLVERAGPLPDGNARATLLLLGVSRLTDAGYVQVGLDHFARPDSALARAAAEHRVVRTFQGYAEHRADTILGLGASAISSTPRLLWQNHSELATWERALEAGLPIARGYALDADDQVRRDVIAALMCYGAADVAAIGAAHGLDGRRYFAGELAELARLTELARYDASAGTLAATPEGRLLVRNLCMVFDRYHAEPSARFSSTI